MSLLRMCVVRSLGREVIGGERHDVGIFRFLVLVGRDGGVMG